MVKMINEKYYSNNSLVFKNRGEIMLKYIYKIIILIIIFVASLFYFSKDIKEVVFNIDNTTRMANAELPVVTLESDGIEVNILHGYKSNLEANKVRDAVLPLKKDKQYNLLIEEFDYDIKKIKFELREVLENELIESNSISVFTLEDNKKIAKVNMSSDLDSSKEYAVKITLIASDGNKINYYHRIKIFEELFLKQEIDFVLDFNKKTLDKKEAEDIIKYLEPKPSSDVTTLSYVNINSNFDLISWGKLSPERTTDIIPTIKECYNDIISIELNYIIKADIEGIEELFEVNEFYRIRYTSSRMYLLNFERRTEAIFDYKLASISKNEFKLGITSSYGIDYEISDDKQRLAFVRNRELWYYDMTNNHIFNVFSFFRENFNNRTLFGNHNVKLLDINQEGNINFLVYGYMNRGYYEGKVGIVLYKYIVADNRVEELLYIPIDKTYELLKEDIGKSIHLNEKSIFYFNIDDKLYTFDLITNQLLILADEISNILISNDKKYILLQEGAVGDSTSIRIIDTLTKEERTIKAPNDSKIILYDMIDYNFIYGYVNKEDIKFESGIGKIIPSFQINISNLEGAILKEYKSDTYYVNDIKVSNNTIELARLNKVNKEFQVAEPDYILNEPEKIIKDIEVNKRVTEKALTQAYFTLPLEINLKEIPNYNFAKATIVTNDPTQRIETSDSSEPIYYPHIFGGIESSYKNISDAIKVADKQAGVVINNKNQIVWERVLRTPSNIIKEIENIIIDGNGAAIDKSILTLLKHQGVDINKIQSLSNKSIYEVYEENSKYTSIMGTGSSLEELLYYVYKDCPVVVYLEKDYPVIIYGYDSFNVLILDPHTRKISKKGINDCSKLIEDTKGLFITFIKN